MVFPKNKATKSGGNPRGSAAARGKRTRSSPTGAAEAAAAVEPPKKPKFHHHPESTTESASGTTTVIPNSSKSSSSSTTATRIVTDEMRMVVHEWYQKWVVERDHHHHTHHQHQSSSRNVVEDPYETVRTVVWPVFCDLVVEPLPSPPPPPDPMKTLSLAQVALVMGYALLQSSSSSSSYHQSSPTSLTLDFIHWCRTTPSESSSLSFWNVWCQSMFQYDDDRTTRKGWYRDASVRIHCLNMIWSALSQQYYYNPDHHHHHHRKNSIHKEDNQDPDAEDFLPRDDMLTTMSQSYISTSTIHGHMPPRYRECHVRRHHHRRTPPNDPDDTTTMPSSSSSFLVRTIQLLLEVLESPRMVLVVPGRAAAVSFVPPDSRIAAHDDEEHDDDDEHDPVRIPNAPTRKDIHDDDDDDHMDPTTTWTEPWKFLHAGLEFVGNLLSTPSIPQQVTTTMTTTTLFHREPIIEYLISIHFMIRAMRGYHRVVASMATHSQKQNRHLVLTQQLLHRLSKWIYSFPTWPMTKNDDADHTTTAVASWTTHHADHTRSMYYHRATIFQKFCHRYYSTQLSDIIYAGPGLLCQTGPNSGPECDAVTTERSPSFLRQALEGLNNEELYTLLYKMRLVDGTPPVASTETVVNGDQSSASHLALLYSDRNFLLAVLEEYLVVPNDPLKELQTYPLYPTEVMLWDFTQIPSSRNTQTEAAEEQPTVLSVPKLSTRYLNFIDYLGRNFELVRYESAYEIRLDLIDAIRRVQPVVRHSTQPTVGSEPSDNTPVKTVFTGWARMALELKGVFEVKQVNQPMLGEIYPSQVVAEFTIDLKLCNNKIRQEWDDLGEYDILFLIAIDASKMQSSLRNEGRSVVPDEDDPTFPQRFGVRLVRGCMILQVRDETGSVLNNFSTDASSRATNHRPSGTKRTFRVALDPTQYSFDRNASTTGMTDIYGTFNLVVRRSGKVNNFKAVLETIRGLMVGVGSIDRVIPTWLQSAILGYGNPIDPTYQSDTMKAYAKSTIGVPNPDAFLDYGDTFVDEQHLRSSFMELSDSIVVDGRNKVMDQTNNDANDALSPNNYRVRVIESSDGNSQSRAIEAVSYQYPRRNITGTKARQGNSIRFTPRQVAAIRSGLSPGLSLIVGPPGTGKTDVAVQIIACLYHSFPTQRTIIITHSNAALNDIFQKVMVRGDVAERYMIRLGSGERELQSTSTHDFTKQGRVAYSLSRRGVLLEKVQQLSESLGISSGAERGVDGASAYTCETADIFYRHHIQKRVNKFEKEMMISSPGEVINADAVASKLFPFSTYFELNDVELTHDEAKGYIHQIGDIFQELAEYRPLEILRSQRQRSDYLIMKQARVVAMTCTHAAIARSHLLELGFEYDNVVIEEAGQMLEIESFVPFLLQRGDTSSSSGSNSICRLKRCCIIGDHHQLPPVIQNMAFAKYSSFDQSLFARLIRFGVPYIQLDQQGRCRPEIANLFNWRYKKLGNLDRVLTSTEFKVANAGLQHTVQLINVDDFEGKGETAPTPYFYQNVGEAEYVVALFQYMVLIGHQPESISILTTYNGQKALIEDILNTRCGSGTPLVGIRPRAVSTVDQYQGQQNDIVLLSLVRTGSTIGHLRDIRRLIVAVSRARFGLYVFCRWNMFRTHSDVNRVLDSILQQSNSHTKLQLIVGEQNPTDRKIDDIVSDDQIYEVDDVVHMGSIVHQMQETMLQDAS